MAGEKRGLNAQQWCAIGGCVALMVWSIPGLIVNPDFGIGTQATSELVLGVDMNGWHAVSGFLVAIPVLLALGNAVLLPWVQAAAAAAIWGTAVWSLATEYPFGGLFYFPNPTGDVVLHLATGSLFAVGAYLGLREQRASAA